MKNTTSIESTRARLPAVLAACALALGMSFAFTGASAAPTLSASVGGVPTGADCYENFDSLTPGSGGGTTACGFGVSFQPDAQAVQGSVASLYAAPVLSNGNGALFGNPDGLDTSVYLAAGSTGAHSGAAVTLDFGASNQERYFGVLWGSVDDYNTLTFFQNGTQVARFTGADVGNSAGAGDCIGGNQAAQGTCYVNINFSAADWFNSVVATSSSYTFEFDNVAISEHNLTDVPEPAELGMFGFGLLLIGAGGWYRKRRET